MILVKTSTHFTKITNARGRNKRLKELKIGQKSWNLVITRNIFLPTIAKKWIKAKMFRLRCSGVPYLSQGSVKYSFDITLMEAITAATVTITTTTITVIAKDKESTCYKSKRSILSTTKKIFLKTGTVSALTKTSIIDGNGIY